MKKLAKTSKPIDIKIAIEEFEYLTKEILESKSPKSYNEVFNFFKKFLKPKQVFFWKFREVHKRKKKKFLSQEKTNIAEFEKAYTEFRNVDFAHSTCVMEGHSLFLRLPILEGNDFYCFYFKDMKGDLPQDELIHFFFSQRLNGILNLIEKMDDVQHLNFIDDVTGLYNQRYLSILLDQEINRYKRADSPFCVLFIDVDHFKLVNDNNGHMVGSQILKEIGNILSNTVRTVDFCFRYGGDEFLVVLTKTETEQALQVAERICQAIRETPFIVGGQHIQVTISIGVANFPEHAKTKEKILQVADEAMYCGKRLSRNIVYLAG